MKFEINWGASTEQELANAWLRATDREAVVRAAHRIDEILSSDPLSVGEARESSVSRFGFFSPLGFTFEVILDDRKAFVTGIWLVQ